MVDRQNEGCVQKFYGVVLYWDCSLCPNATPKLQIPKSHAVWEKAAFTFTQIPTCPKEANFLGELLQLGPATWKKLDPAFFQLTPDVVAIR